MLSISEPFTLERKYFSMICEAACREDCEKMAVMLEQEMQRIMDFFGLKELSRNLMIYMTSDREVYKAHMEKIAGQNESIQYFDWMIADTYDNDINLLSLEACHEIEMHKEFDEEEYRKLIVHEFVHICHRHCFCRTVTWDKFCVWFWEALATVLSGQNYPDIRIECTPEQLLTQFPDIPDSYTIANNIGKYMMKTMSHEKILHYIYQPEDLANDLAGILEQMKKIPGSM